MSVVENLDHEGFYLPDEDALSLLMSVYHHACQVHSLMSSAEF